MPVENLPHISNVIFGMNPMVLSTAILIISYIILFTEKLNRAVVALIGASVMIFTGILTQETALKGIDFNTLALLIGMMTIVGISEKSGMFQYVAIWSAKKVKANPRGILVVLSLVTAVFSAFLDNVTTDPYLIAEIFASNIGGTATLIGDPPNILIGSAINLSFTDFLFELTPVVAFTMLVQVIIFDFIWGKRIVTTDEHKKLVMGINEVDSITDWTLLKKSLFVLTTVILGFICAEHFHIANGTIAMFGAAVLLLLYTLGEEHSERERKVEEALGLVDWTTIFFFAGLFAIVYGLEEAGVLELMGQKFIEMTEGSIEKAAMLVIWVSAFVSTAIDNIPFVATMIPMIKSMEESMGGREAMMPVWWALSLGACFGGNGSLIAASANVIVAGMAQREGHPISFLKFLIWSIPTMLISTGIAAMYLHLRHFM